MSHHNNQEFPGVLIDEMDRILVQIRQINDQAEALISRARDIAALAKRTVSENVKVHLESMKAEDRIRQADQVIEREAQRDVERREQEIDEGRIAPATHPLRGPDILFDTGSQPVTGAVPLAKHGEFDPSPRLVLGIVNNEAGAFIRGVDGNLKPMFDREREHDANGGNLIPSGEDLAGDESNGADDRLSFDVIPAGGPVVGRDPSWLAGVIDYDDRVPPAPLAGKTLEEAAVEFVRGTIAAQTQIDESPAAPPSQQEVHTGAADAVSPQPAEAAPVDTNSTRIEIATIRDNSVRSMWPGLNEHAAADEPTVPAGDAHDEAPAADTFEVDTGAGYMVVATIEDGRVKYLGPKNMAEPEQESAEKKGPAETAAEEAKVIPPEDSSAGWSLRQQDLDKLSTTARQNANAREAAEFSDKVLDLWNSTLLTEAQIAKRLATGKSLISQIVEQARVDQDPRVMGKRGVVAKLPKETLPLSAMARKIMERPVPVAAARAGVELGDFKPPVATAENLVSSGVCVVDLSRNKIFGKKGVWTTDSSRARTIANLNNGQMYPVSVIQQRCGWRDERELRDAITPMMERLRDIGIIMTSLPTGIVIRVDD